jgi:hypothetical protein
MRIKLAIFSFFLFFAENTAHSAIKYYLPQVAIGSYEDGSFRTTFLFLNNHYFAANVTLKLTDNDGAPMSVTIPRLGTNSTFAFVLPPFASRIYQTDSSGYARAGAATVTTEMRISVSGIFTIYDKVGNFATEAGVGISDPLHDFVIPVEVIGNYNTGLALFNPYPYDSYFTATLTNTDGTIAGITALTLPAGKHMGVYVGGNLYKNISNFQGTLRIQSTVAISALTLRQNAVPLSYTSCPVIPIATTQRTFNLAQVANGASSDIGYKTSFMFFNMSSSTANVNLALTKDDGTSLSVTIPGQGARSSFSFSLGAGKSLFLQTDGAGTLSRGAAIINTDIPIGVAGIITVYDSQGNFQTEAGVADSPAFADFALFIDSNTAHDTGIALFNPLSIAVTITPRFLDSEGISTTGKGIMLPAYGHTATFFSQLFPGLGNAQGSLTISAMYGISALTMRINFSPYSLTSLPVVESDIVTF